MNGISSTLKEEIKKGQLIKNREKLRLLAAILLSNAMVALLCLSGQESSPPSPKKQNYLHANHQILLLKLNALVEVPKSTDRPVDISILSAGRKMLIAKAYLHSQVTESDDGPRFKIEIPDTEVLKVNAMLNEELIAVPYVEQKYVAIKKAEAGGSRYETTL